MVSRRPFLVFMSWLTLAVPAVGFAQAPAKAVPTAAKPAQAAPVPAAGEATGAQPPVGYVLGPADVIDVEIPGRSDFRVHTRIGQDGLIDLPYLHTVSASNRTTRQLGEEIGRALDAGGFFSHPVVSVEVANYASRNVTVLGAVGTPGLVPIDRPYRLSEILARVGGTRDDGADFVLVRSADGKEKKLFVKDLATGGADQDPYIEPGDKIYVPKAEMFYLSGQVKAPSVYPLAPDMTLRMAIAKGGGVTDQGSENRVRITRAGKEIHLDLESKIQAGDVIVIGERLF